MSEDILNINETERLLRDPEIQKELMATALEDLKSELGQDVNISVMTQDELNAAFDRFGINRPNNPFETELLQGIKLNKVLSEQSNNEFISGLRETYKQDGELVIRPYSADTAIDSYDTLEVDKKPDREVGVGNIFDFRNMPEDIIFITDIDEYKDLPDGDYFSDSSNKRFARPEDAIKFEFSYIKNVDAKDWLSSTFTPKELAQIKSFYRSTRNGTQAYQAEIAKDYFAIAVFKPRENAELDRYLLDGKRVNPNTLYFRSNVDFEEIEKDIRRDILKQDV